MDQTVGMREDRGLITLDLPENPKFTTKELDKFIVQLARVRSQMLPAHKETDPEPRPQLSPIDGVRWFVGRSRKTTPGGIELWLLHPGFGWIRSQLAREHFAQLVETAKLVLHDP